MTEYELARALGWARVVSGTAFMLAPAKSSKLWMGRDVDSVYTRMAGRSLGARDLALGMGLLTGLRRNTPVRGWLEAGMLSDAIDGFNALRGMRRLPKVRSLAILGAAVGSVAVSRNLVDALD